MKKTTLLVFRWTLSLFLALVLSYLLVGYMLDHSTPSATTAEDLLVANDLRTFTNDLIVITDEFMNKDSDENMKEIAAFESWVSRSFHPRINDLRQRLVHTDISNAALTALLAATDRCAALATRPHDERLRDSATGAIADAVLETERYIGQFDSTERVTPRALTPSFARR